MFCRRCAITILAALLLLPVACGPDQDIGVKPRSLPHLTGLESRLQKLPGEDGEWVRDYLAGGGTLSQEINDRHLSEILGRMLHADPPEDVAEFIQRSQARLYDDFFFAFSDLERRTLATALRLRCGEGTVLAEKYAAVMAAPSFPATLDLKLRSLPLQKIAQPSKMTPERVLGIARSSKNPDVLLGAAEVLVAESWVLFQDEHHRRRAFAAARMLLDEASEKMPDEPAVAMSRTLLQLQSDVTNADFLQICLAAAVKEKGNGAYPYLAAFVLGESGRDEETVGVVKKGLSQPFVTFHEVRRARAVAVFLRSAGLGPVGARLAAYCAAPVQGPMQMNRLSQLLRSNPVASAGSPSLAVSFPRRLGEQLAARPRILATELIRMELLLGSWEWSLGESPTSKEAMVFRKELDRLEAGMQLASGPAKWDELLGKLGEERFLRYIDQVLFGGESEFLQQCSSFTSLDECAALIE